MRGWLVDRRVAIGRGARRYWLTCGCLRAYLSLSTASPAAVSERRDPRQRGAEPLVVFAGRQLEHHRVPPASWPPPPLGRSTDTESACSAALPRRQGANRFSIHVFRFQARAAIRKYAWLAASTPVGTCDSPSPCLKVLDEVLPGRRGPARCVSTAAALRFEFVTTM